MKSSDVARIQTRSRALEQVNWRDMHIAATEGAVAVYGRDAVKAVTRRSKLHSALDAILSKMNRTQDDGVRMHTALDKLLDGGGSKTQSQILGDLLDEELEANQNRILHEPSEEGGDEEEESDDDAEPNEEHAKVKIPYDKLHGSLDAMSLDQLRRRLDSTFGADDAAGLSRTLAMDAAGDLKLGEPGDVAMDAIAKLPIRFDINPRAKAPWFHSLFTWISKYPKGARVRDLHQRTLKYLLHELRTAA